MKESQEGTKMHLQKAMEELAAFYQKDGYDWKMAWFFTYTAAEQWKALDQFIQQNQDIAFHTFNTKGRDVAAQLKKK